MREIQLLPMWRLPKGRTSNRGLPSDNPRKDSIDQQSKAMPKMLLGFAKTSRRLLDRELHQMWKGAQPIFVQHDDQLPVKAESGQIQITLLAGNGTETRAPAGPR